MTLLEAMIAVMILSFVLVSVLAVCSHCYRYITDLRQAATSSQMLQQKVEDLRLVTNWSSLTALANTTFSNSNYPGLLGRISEVNYTASDFGSTTTVIKVTLSVTWTNRSRTVITNSLSTLIANGGLNSYIY